MNLVAHCLEFVIVHTCSDPGTPVAPEPFATLSMNDGIPNALGIVVFRGFLALGTVITTKDFFGNHTLEVMLWSGVTGNTLKGLTILSLTIFILVEVAHMLTSLALYVLYASVLMLTLH